MARIVDTLLQSEEPSIRYRVRAELLGENPGGRAMKRLRREIKDSLRVQAYLANRDAGGRIMPSRHGYRKHQGAHWTLAALAYGPTGKTRMNEWVTADALYALGKAGRIDV